MYSTITPEDGYCLYFPNREVGERYEAGRRVRAWIWEEWKHVKLGQFSVLLEKELATTIDPVECYVRAEFFIVIGGQEKGREGRLERATISCPPTRDIRKKVEFDHFKPWATNYCRSSIARVLQKCTYAKLVEDADYRATAVQNIQEDVTSTLDTIGLWMVRSSITIEPQEPKGVAATDQLLGIWLRFRKTLDVAALARQEAENERKAEEAEQERKSFGRMQAILQMRRIEETSKEEATRVEEARIKAETAIAEKTHENHRDEQISMIQKEMAQRAQAVQLERIRCEAELRDKRDREERQHQEQSLEHELQILAKKKEAKTSELEVVELDGQISTRRMEQNLNEGLAKAQVSENETLAKAADAIKMRGMLLSALPQIMENANRPMEKMGEIRMIALQGGDHSTHDNNSLFPLLASMSSLPMIKECLRFLREWEFEESGPNADQAGRPEQTLPR